VQPFGALWYGEPGAISNAIGYAKFFSRSHAVIRVYDEAGNAIETHENTGRVQRAVSTTTLPISGEMLLLVWPVQLYRLLRTVCAAISSHQAGALTFWAIYSAQYATTNPRLLRFTLPRAGFEL